MDGIITIAVIAVAIIFKIIEKKLKGAAGDEVFPTITPDQEILTDPEPEVKIPVTQETKREFVKKTPVKPVKNKVEEPILVENEKVAKEKIDPKKLVIYSEIMKPKYTE